MIDNTQENRGDAPGGGRGGIREDPERPGQTGRGRPKEGRGERRRAVHSSVHPARLRGARIHAEKYKITTLRRRRRTGDDRGRMKTHALTEPAGDGSHLLLETPPLVHDDLNNILAPNTARERRRKSVACPRHKCYKKMPDRRSKRKMEGIRATANNGLPCAPSVSRGLFHKIGLYYKPQRGIY